MSHHGNWKVTDQKCPCGNSSRGYAIDAHDHGFCFACGKNFWPDGIKPEGAEDYVPDETTLQYVPWRDITRDTMQFYGVQTEMAGNTPKAVLFPYANGQTKVRLRAEKKFYVNGEVKATTGFLFGRDKFNAGSAQAVTITEGEMDALAAFQMLGSKYPVVSIRGASSAESDCTADHDFLNSFDKIYIAFDNDEAGRNATRKVAALFDFNKVYHVKLDLCKDANEYLSSGKAQDFIKTWWNSKRFLPEGVLSTFEEFDGILDNEETKASVPYPLQKLQEMTYGIRTGEFILVTAMEGIGKTEVLRNFEHHLLKTTNENLGIIHLEESKGRTLKGLAGLELAQPVHLPDTSVSKKEIKGALHTLLGRDERLHVYSHFGSDDPDVILDTIRFMAGPCRCRYIFLDHITLVVTGLQSEDERKQLDYLSTKLAMMVEDHDFALFCVSHVNDDGLTRGSRNISKVADLHIHLDRDITAPTAELRNITELTVRKNRFAGKTGPAGRLRFNGDTFTLTEELEMPK